MKKLLGVIGILALAAALLPAQGYADLRGAFAPITSQDGQLTVNGLEQGAFRPVDAGGIMIFPADAGGRFIEEWIAMSNRSLIPGRESVRSIYLHLVAQQSGYFAPLKHDPAANTSYFDPAWSSDGRFLAYVQTDFDGSNQALYVQEYFVNDDFEEGTCSPGGCGVYPAGEGADSPIGAPILVTTAGNPRHPNWSPTGHTLAFDSNVAGNADIYTSEIDIAMGTAGALVRRTFVDDKAETDPSWAPNGHEIAYVTNKFGPKVIEIIDLNLSSGDPAYTRLAERNFAFVTHGNPDWTSDGGTIYYDAPSGEDPSAVTSVWKLDLFTQGKCEIQFDNRADSDPDVSGIVNFTQAGDGAMPFNYFAMTSQGANIGVQIWKVNPINSCLLPLAMGIATEPSVLDINDETTETFTTTLNFPPETRAAGYRCRSTNAAGLDGVRLRNSFGIFSPTLLGLVTPAGGGVGGTTCFDINTHDPVDSFKIVCDWDFRTIADRVVALGLVGDVVPMKMTAYSNQLGRGFQGFAYLRLVSSTPAPVALLGNSPNPFNPVTKIKFAVKKPGNYALRLYSVQGALIRTVANQRFDAGTHEVTWDGRTSGGAMAASGVYYAKISDALSKGAGSEGIKLVLAK